MTEKSVRNNLRWILVSIGVYIWRLHLVRNFTSRLKPVILFDLGAVHILV